MIFPDPETLARAMFEEGVRHLDDARILHDASRYPAAIVSAMKSAELGFKAVLLLEGALGWWENVLTSHSPVTDASRHPVLRGVVAGLPPGLVLDIQAMEKLAPARIGKKAFGQNVQDQDEKNPEYPFVAPDAVRNVITVVKPSESFTEAESRTYFGTARTLLEQLTARYARINQWNVPLAPPL